MGLLHMRIIHALCLMKVDAFPINDQTVVSVAVVVVVFLRYIIFKNFTYSFLQSILFMWYPPKDSL